jgi:hypothetical protein
MSSLPHASSTSLPGVHGAGAQHSHSRRRVSRRGAFPPPPKSVRIWQVQASQQAPSEDEPEPVLNSRAPVSPASPMRIWAKYAVPVWIMLTLSGILGLATWLFVFQLK